MLKNQPYVSLAYMTGILPVKKYGEHSALNMFDEYSMTNQRELAEFTGFTGEEVEKLCDEYDMPYDKMKQWYDGYDLKEYRYIIQGQWLCHFLAMILTAIGRKQKLMKHLKSIYN